MIGTAVGLAPQYSIHMPVAVPAGFTWDQGRFPLAVTKSGAGYRSGTAPRNLVNPAIWTGPAYHVDSATGNDANSGLGAFEGDFSTATRTIHRAFALGNATGAPYRVLVKAGQYEESAFTQNGSQEPNQHVAILGWGGAVRYRTGPFSVAWVADAGGTYRAALGSVKRVLRTDVLTEKGQYTELTLAASLALCRTTPNSWFDASGTVHVNIGKVPATTDIAAIRSFHGARFLTHASDFYIENVHCEGGITGALHLDADAARNVVGVNCTFRYSAPSAANSPLDAARVRRTNGLAAFFDCDASMGAKDGWSFHEDGVAGLHVLLERCTGHYNGIDPATSCNGFSTHDAIRAVALSCDFGLSRNGTEVHMIQTTQTWLAGVRAVARDIDGTSVAFKCSNPSFMWLQDCIADAAGGTTNFAIEANAGTVYTRDFQAVAGTIELSLGGSVTPF
jgi:hypothetical protein